MREQFEMNKNHDVLNTFNDLENKRTNLLREISEFTNEKMTVQQILEEIIDQNHEIEVQRYKQVEQLKSQIQQRM